MSKYKHPVCRGSMVLGTGCGKCERCEEYKKQVGLKEAWNTFDLRTDLVRIQESMDDCLEAQKVLAERMDTHRELVNAFNDKWKDAKCQR